MLSCEEVKIELHDYIDQLLDKTTQKEIETHLRSCESCFNRSQKIAAMFSSLENLPGIIELPSDIRESLSDELLKKSMNRKVDDTPLPRIDPKKLKREQARLEKELLKSSALKNKSRIVNTRITKINSARFFFSRSGLTIKKTLITILPLILIGAGYTVFDFLKLNSPWEVEWKYGNYSINGIENANLELAKGQTLATKDSSQVILYVPQTGRIELNSNSSVTLLKAKNGGNKILFNRGSIKIITTAIIPYLSVEIGKYIVRDVGGVFSIKVINPELTTVFIDFGMAEILYNGKSFMLDEGYNSDLIKGRQPGTPYRFDATDSLKHLIKIFDDKNGDDELVDKIVEQAQKSDALSLLALIPKVSPVKRQILFQKISNYFSPPKDVTRMGVVTLDLDMLNSWWNEIEWQI